MHEICKGSRKDRQTTKSISSDIIGFGLLRMMMAGIMVGKHMSKRLLLNLRELIQLKHQLPLV